MQLAAFIRESIVNPNAYIAPGYPKSVMPQTFGSTLTKTQLGKFDTLTDVDRLYDNGNVRIYRMGTE